MILVNFIGALWALPLTLLAAIFLLPWYGVSDLEWDWRTFRLLMTARRMAGSPTAQTIGSLMFVTPRFRPAFKSSPLWPHEDWHRVQAYIFGVLFGVAYGLEFAVRFVFPGPPIPDRRKGNLRWYRAYWRLSWERWARSRETR